MGEQMEISPNAGGTEADGFGIDSPRAEGPTHFLERDWGLDIAKPAALWLARPAAAPAMRTLAGRAANTIVLIDPQTFSRDCIAQCLSLACDELDVLSFASAKECHAAGVDQRCAAVILFNIHQQRVSDPDVEHDFSAIERLFPSAASVLLADVDGIDLITAALSRGARGYIVTSTKLSVVVEAIRLVRAGGIFIPASSFTAASGPQSASSDAADDRAVDFSPRQLVVLKQLRKGRSNKLIARELAMSESAVKAHVRNIMKKLGAANRTEVVCLTQGQLRP
jgi:DNA-binding NarL/FixJ family response regulator